MCVGAQFSLGRGYSSGRGIAAPDYEFSVKGDVTMRNTRCLVALLLGVVGVQGCGDAPNSGPKVGGMTECTEEAVGKAATAWVKSRSEENAFDLDHLDCADGWAVASGSLGPEEAPADGPQGAPTSLIFQQEGQFWIPKEKAKVCGTLDPAVPLERPADAEVPAALWLPGCAAG